MIFKVPSQHKSSVLPGLDSMGSSIPQPSTLTVTTASTPSPTPPPTPSLKYLLQFSNKPTRQPTVWRQRNQKVAYIGRVTPKKHPAQPPQKLIGLEHKAQSKIVEPTQFKHSAGVKGDAALFANLVNQLNKPKPTTQHIQQTANHARKHITKVGNTVVKQIDGVQVSYTGLPNERQKLMGQQLRIHRAHSRDPNHDDDPVSGSRDDDDDITHTSKVNQPQVRQKKASNAITPAFIATHTAAKPIVGMPIPGFTARSKRTNAQKSPQTTYATQQGVEIAYSGLSPSQIGQARHKKRFEAGDDDPLATSTDDDHG